MVAPMTNPHELQEQLDSYVRQGLLAQEMHLEVRTLYQDALKANAALQEIIREKDAIIQANLRAIHSQLLAQDAADHAHAKQLRELEQRIKDLEW